MKFSEYKAAAKRDHPEWFSPPDRKRKTIKRLKKMYRARGYGRK